jgi:hypothetical protein
LRCKGQQRSLHGKEMPGQYRSRTPALYNQRFRILMPRSDYF